MFKKKLLILATSVIFTSTLLINCGDNSKKENIICSKSKVIKEKSKKETLEESKYYINKNYNNLLNICKEWHYLKELIEEKNNEVVKNKVFLIFEDIKKKWSRIEKIKVPNSYESENFSNELKFVKEKQLKAIECFTEGINNKKSECINEGSVYLKESNKYIYSDIIPYVEQINTTLIN